MTRRRNRNIAQANGWRKAVISAEQRQANKWRCTLECGHVVDVASNSNQPKNVQCGQCRPSAMTPGNHFYHTGGPPRPHR